MFNVPFFPIFTRLGPFFCKHKNILWFPLSSFSPKPVLCHKIFEQMLQQLEAQLSSTGSSEWCQDAGPCTFQGGLIEFAKCARAPFSWQAGKSTWTSPGRFHPGWFEWRVSVTTLTNPHTQWIPSNCHQTLPPSDWTSWVTSPLPEGCFFCFVFLKWLTYMTWKGQLGVWRNLSSLIERWGTVLRVERHQQRSTRLMGLAAKQKGQKHRDEMLANKGK